MGYITLFMGRVTEAAWLIKSYSEETENCFTACSSCCEHCEPAEWPGAPLIPVACSSHLLHTHLVGVLVLPFVVHLYLHLYLFRLFQKGLCQFQQQSSSFHPQC